MNTRHEARGGDAVLDGYRGAKRRATIWDNDRSPTRIVAAGALKFAVRDLATLFRRW